MNSENSEPQAQHTASPQPCRGCTTDCKFINTCEGTPWRMSDETVAACLEVSTEN